LSGRSHPWHLHCLPRLLHSILAVIQHPSTSSSSSRTIIKLINIIVKILIPRYNIAKVQIIQIYRNKLLLVTSGIVFRIPGYLAFSILLQRRQMSRFPLKKFCRVSDNARATCDFLVSGLTISLIHTLRNTGMIQIFQNLRLSLMRETFQFKYDTISDLLQIPNLMTSRKFQIPKFPAISFCRNCNVTD